MKRAGIMLIIKDGLILGISRRHDKTIFGLPGGSHDEALGDVCTQDTAIREVEEETSIRVKDCVFLYKRVEFGGIDKPIDFESDCYYATEYEGAPANSEEGEVKWLTVEELTSTKAAFGDYNANMLNRFREMFPEVYLRQGENE